MKSTRSSYSVGLAVAAALTLSACGGAGVPTGPSAGDGRETAAPSPRLELGPAGTPGPRLGAAMAWDEKDAYLLMFGGARFGPSGNIAYDDTWAWTGRDWRELKPAASPPGRTFGAMAFDPMSQRVLLFGGGAANSDPVRNDTWAWDGTNWTELHPADTPGLVWEARMVYDPELPGLLLVSQAARGDVDYATTWTWTGSIWKQLQTGRSVTRRAGFGLAYVKELGAVLVGGYVSLGPNGQRDDVWVFKGGAWSQLSQATGPVPGGSVIIAYDTARRTLVLFSNGTNQTWTLDGSTWVLQHPAHSPPALLSFATIGYHPLAQQVVLFGGKSDSVRDASGYPSVLDQTWSWKDGDWQRLP